MRFDRRMGISVLILLLLTVSAYAQSDINHWETAIFSEDDWHYFVGDYEPSALWYDTSFVANTWSIGPGGFGYNDGDDSTIIDSTISLYTRIDFHISDTSKLKAAIVNADFDDAIVIYLNGNEMFRSGISGEHPTFDQVAESSHEAVMYKGGYPSTTMIDGEMLSEFIHPGKNTLAVQTHNRSITSSDFSSIVYLSFGISDESTYFRTPPSWFNPPRSHSSNLPLVIINTGQGVIQRDSMITANMKVIDNGVGAINNVSDSANVYDGYIGIRIRGNSSAGFPTKPYRIETRDSLGENNNVTLFDMPKENDWALINNYKDRTFVKHSLSYKLSMQMGHYAARSKHCEVVVNGMPQGIYMFSEILKQDKNRVDIAKLKDIDIVGDQVTGGYIFKVDYYESDGSDSWVSSYNPPHNDIPVHFVYEDPESEELQPEQKYYIQEFVKEFEEVLYSDNFKDTITGYRAYINVPSFINYLIMQEVSCNGDGYKKSCHFHKDKERDNIRALLNAGPVWDFDWAYRYGQRLRYLETLNEMSPTPVTWMPRLMEDPQFANEMFTTYARYRETVLSINNIYSYIDSVQTMLGDAKDTHFDLYYTEDGDRDTYFDKQKEILKAWISKQLLWLDDNLPGEIIALDEFIDSPITYIDSSGIGTSSEMLSYGNNNEIIVYPNPATNVLTIMHPEVEIKHIEIISIMGQKVREIDAQNTSNITIDISNILPGIYVTRTRLINNETCIVKFIKK